MTVKLLFFLLLVIKNMMIKLVVMYDLHISELYNGIYADDDKVSSPWSTGLPIEC